jgi:hypothetical protein
VRWDFADLSPERLTVVTQARDLGLAVAAIVVLLSVQDVRHLPATPELVAPPPVSTAGHG